MSNVDVRTRLAKTEDPAAGPRRCADTPEMEGPKPGRVREEGARPVQRGAIAGSWKFQTRRPPAPNQSTREREEMEWK